MPKENLFKSNLNLNKSEKLAESLLGVRENIKKLTLKILWKPSIKNYN